MQSVSCCVWLLTSFAVLPGVATHGQCPILAALFNKLLAISLCFIYITEKDRKGPTMTKKNWIKRAEKGRKELYRSEKNYY